MVPLFSNEQNTVVLSGPTGGLGRELFELLSRRGYPLVCLGRDLGRLPTNVGSEKAPVDFVGLDFGGKKQSLFKAQCELEAIFMLRKPRSTVFISNVATIEPIGRSIDSTFESLEEATRINLLTPLMIGKTITRATKRNNLPLFIINIDSGASANPIKGWQAYCATKAAYRMGLDVLALENPLVEVLHYDPGSMDTPMQQVIRTKRKSQMPDVANFRRLKAQGRLKKPGDVAADVLQIVERRLR